MIKEEKMSNKDTTVMVKEDVLLKIKVLAAVVNKPRNDLIDEMIKEYVKNHNIKVTGVF